jgi:hypothetical protein
LDDFRAKLLGFLPIVSGAGLFLLLGRVDEAANAHPSSSVTALPGVIGALVTIGLLVYEERGIQNCVRLATIGQELEKAMGVRGRFLERPQSVGRIVNEPVASGVVYSTLIGSWMFLAIAPWSTTAAVIGAVVTGVCMFFLTRGFYWWITWAEEQRRGAEPTQNWWNRRGPFSPGRQLRHEQRQRNKRAN